LNGDSRASFGMLVPTRREERSELSLSGLARFTHSIHPAKMVSSTLIWFDSLGFTRIEPPKSIPTVILTESRFRKAPFPAFLPSSFNKEPMPCVFAPSSEPYPASNLGKTFGFGLIHFDPLGFATSKHVQPLHETGAAVAGLCEADRVAPDERGSNADCPRASKYGRIGLIHFDPLGFATSKHAQPLHETGAAVAGLCEADPVAPDARGPNADCPRASKYGRIGLIHFDSLGFATSKHAQPLHETGAAVAGLCEADRVAPDARGPNADCPRASKYGRIGLIHFDPPRSTPRFLCTRRLCQRHVGFALIALIYFD
jgi:ATP-dependent Clp protease adapter protein ClpS